MFPFPIHPGMRRFKYEKWHTPRHRNKTETDWFSHKEKSLLTKSDTDVVWIDNSSMSYPGRPGYLTYCLESQVKIVLRRKNRVIGLE
jgi:hypothetical protein